VELVGGDPGLLAAVATRLSAAGARDAVAQSKLARALGDRVPSAALPTEAVDATRDGTAAALVDERIRGLVGRLHGYDPLVRADAPDAVHAMRVAIRRLRSALATYRPLLDRQVTDPLRIDLRWVSAVLGDARDAEVLRERLLADLDDLPPEDVRGPIRDFLDEELAAAYRRAHERAVESMSTDRYLGLLDRLDELVEDLSRRGGDSDDGPAVLRRRVRHDWKRLAHKVDALDGLSDEEYVEGLHEVRKAAKRARYAAEPLVPVDGKDAKRFAKAMKGLQSSLGRHQDSVVVEEQLRLLADRAAAAGVNAFTLGRLQPPVEAEAVEQQARFPSDWRRASRKKLRAWTDRS
jgi:CHAD domain-containing protein